MYGTILQRKRYATERKLHDINEATVRELFFDRYCTVYLALKDTCEDTAVEHEVRRIIMELGRLIAFLVVLPFAFGCDANSVMSTLSSESFFMIQGSALHFHWDFRNMSSNLYYLEIEYNCYNPYIPADGYNKWTTQKLVNNFVLLNISESNKATSCEVCIEGSDTNVLSTKVSFSFGNYCSNGHYNISSDSQKIVIQSSNVACFSCTLPGQIKADIWQVNGTETALDITAVGSLIVTNPSEVFGDSSMPSELICRNSQSNITMTALITYRDEEIKMNS
ncbi:hypothetical protein EMCRGX_G018036 [Ephydatia muelleri]